MHRRDKVDRQDILWELTKSICPTCRLVIDAQVLLREGRVIMRKRCPEHGQVESLVFGDAQLYTEIARYNKPGTYPLEFTTDVSKGCPLDCGLCPEHQQHVCLGIIELNNTCNLDCPLCFANAGSHVPVKWELTIEQVESMLGRLVATEGNPEVVQFSGGEPTVHKDLIQCIAMAKEMGISYVMVNTNGIRIARDDRLLGELGRLKPHVYLQFDGFEAGTSQALRGRSDLVDVKLRALDRLAEADIRVVLVAAIERGINEHEIGRIVQFGLRHPAVFGVSFQPAFRAQRHPSGDPFGRITIPEVLRGLEAQTAGLFRLRDFVPVPCCMPTCNFVTYALVDGANVGPITRVVDADLYLDYIKNRTVPGLSDEVLRVLERLWSSSAPIGSDDAAVDVVRAVASRGGPVDLWERQKEGHLTAGCSSCESGLPFGAHAPRDLSRHVFMVNTRDFMDPWTFNVKNAMKCCVAFVVPDGRMIPFCAYNSVGYREQVTATLMRSR